MLTRADARRRWFGAFFLIVSIGLLIWGTTLLNAYLMSHPLAFIFYWMACALCTGMALLNALLDMIIMRKRSRDEQVALAEQHLSAIEAEKKRRLQ
jgi:hypothetical protein